MGKILRIVEKHSGGKCFYSERYSLDHFIVPEYQDKDEAFKNDRIFETHNTQGKNIPLKYDLETSSLFNFFLDGSRRTYKIADFASSDNKFLPIVGGQIGAAVCYRHEKKVKKYKIKKKNVLAVPDRMGGEFDRIEKEISKVKRHNFTINKLLEYRYSQRPELPFESLAIAKIQVEMLNMEIELIEEMVKSKKLRTDQMLIVDGSLQFSGIIGEQESIFLNVIGISKTFNPHLQGILKTKRKEIGYHLINLKFGERTAVYEYETSNNIGRTRKIGAWYLRMRPKKYLGNPLDGIIKVEKVATTRKEKSDGFDSSQIDEISRAILLERNVTSYGSDKRWANHLYPIYLTEMFIKNSFASEIYFLNIF